MELRMPKLVLVTATLQTLIFLAVLGMGLPWAGGGVFPNSLILSGLVFAPFAVPAAPSAFGLWRKKRFGWIVGLCNGFLGNQYTGDGPPGGIWADPVADRGTFLRERCSPGVQ